MSEKWTSLPNAVAKRDLLFGVKKAESSEWKAWGDKFVGADWLYDGIDFLARTNDRASLLPIRQKAVTEGNVFLFLKIMRALDIADLDAETTALLKTCAENAEKAGMVRYAIKGFERLGDTERAEKLRQTIASDGDILAEAAAKVFIPPTGADDLEDSDEA
ncbi:MAG: hypothetical protein JST16_08760 [Bdellovibrionales bacterium]|nr:hypothetical protein [Bdellovibrionales bacterium]